MNFKQLEYVLAIWHEGSLSHAAKKLYITQPALSQQLHKLEEELGTPLFDRSCTPLRPTYAGRYYLEKMEKILYENQQALKWLEDASTLNRGKIVLGISSIRGIQFLPLILPGFQKEYPHIEIEIKEAPAFAQVEMIRKGEIDFAFMIARSDNTDLTFLPMIRELVLLAVPTDLPVNRDCQECAVRRGSIDFKLLKDQPFILLKKGHRLREIAYDQFSQAGIMPPVLLETENVNLAHKLAASGLGLTLVGSIAPVLAPVLPPPAYYPVSGDNCIWELGIACHPQKYISKAMDAFFSYARQKMDDLTLPPHAKAEYPPADA